jgi:hypothetical protein
MKMLKKLSEYTEKNVGSPYNRYCTCFLIEMEAAVKILEQRWEERFGNWKLSYTRSIFLSRPFRTKTHFSPQTTVLWLSMLH